MKSINVQFIRTCYPHWGRFSGIHQFINHLSDHNFRTDSWVVADSDADFPIQNLLIRSALRLWVQSSGMGWYKLSDLVAEFRALQKCYDGSVDLIHYLDGEHSAQYLPKLRKALGAQKKWPKLLATFHQPPEVLKNLVDKNAISALDRIVVMSPSQVDFFSSFIEPSKIHIILHGIDTQYFQPAKDSQNDNSFHCLTVGRYLRDFEALRKVASMLEDRTDIKFHVVSPDPFESGGLNNIIFHTKLDDLKLLKLYQQSHALFLPLIDATANNALLEGMACGLPIISTDLPSVKAYVTKDAAILTEKNRPQDLANAVLQLFNNTALRGRMALAARQRAEELAWGKVARLYESLYLEVCEQKMIRSAV
jgi:glycosyltransferase involved in cell wall biosynthesis